MDLGDEPLADRDFEGTDVNTLNAIERRRVGGGTRHFVVYRLASENLRWHNGQVLRLYEEQFRSADGAVLIASSGLRSPQLNPGP
ncbi:MAG TPA: hypothetical protein VLG28_05100 [Acidimicrobiia bacterium]|nr:hypothetical protein [Acidimicrobiia bacterium]